MIIKIEFHIAKKADSAFVSIIQAIGDIFKSFGITFSYKVEWEESDL